MERMKMLSSIKMLTVLLVMVLASQKIQAQGDLSIGVKTGYMKFMPWSHTGEFDQLTTINRRNFMIGIHLTKQINNDYFVKAEANFTHYNPVEAFSNGQFGSQIKGSNNPLIQITPSIHRQIFIVPSRFGLQVGLGLMLQHNFSKDFTFVGNKNFQSLKITEMDPNGNPISRPRFDLTFTRTESKGPELAIYLRPEAGFFYDLKNGGRISLDMVYGLPLNGPIMVKNYDEILFEGQTSSAKHELNGNYFAFMVGYAIRIKSK